MMSATAHDAQLFLLAGVTYLVLGSLATAVLVRLSKARLSRWEPHARNGAIAILAALPVACALGLLFAASLPSLVAIALPGFDHSPCTTGTSNCVSCTHQAPAFTPTLC